MRPVLSYACATWATTKGDEEKLLRFEKKILRKIHGPIYSQEEQKWKIRSNNELRALFKRQNVVQFVRSMRLEWMGHVWRADGRLLKSLKRRNGRNETTSKMDGQCTGDNDETYAIKRNKLGYGKGQREMERFSFSSKMPKWLVKIREKNIYNIIMYLLQNITHLCYY